MREWWCSGGGVEGLDVGSGKTVLRWREERLEIGMGGVFSKKASQLR